MQRDYFFTSIALNYLPKALALASSVFDIYPNSKFVISLIDQNQLSTIQITALEKLVEDFRSKNKELSFIDPLSFYSRSDQFIYKFNIVEACTAVKPAIAAALLEIADTVTYLDPDTFLYASFPSGTRPDWEFQVTPHAISPSNTSSLISERLFMFYGVYNLGYFAVRKSEQTLAFLDWWKNFCIEFGSDAPHAGLFVDQKPVDLLTCFVDKVDVLRHPGCNVAWWNIFSDGRKVEAQNQISFKENKYPLIFYHFSNLHINATPSLRMIANPLKIHLDRRKDISIMLSDYPDLTDLYADYDSKVNFFTKLLNFGKLFSKKQHRKAPSIYSRTIFSEAIRRGMDYPTDPNFDSSFKIWRCSMWFITKSISINDLKVLILLTFSITRLIISVNLLRFTKWP